MTTALPATTSTCSVIGCDHATDLESTTRTGPARWTIVRSCFDHATPDQLDAVLAAR